MLASALGLVLGLAAAGGEPRFGVAAISGATACLASPGASLADDAAVVTLVVPEKPQRVSRAVVKGRVSACTTLERAGIEGPYYEIAGPPVPGETPMAVAILGTVKATVSNDLVEMTAAAPGEPITVRSCSSNEGLHLTAWRGKPLQGRRLWHVYWYLGYDVDPSCTKKEVAP